MQRFARPAEPCKEIKPGEFEEKPSKIGTSNWDIPKMCVKCSLNYILYLSALYCIIGLLFLPVCTQWVAILSVPHLPPPKSFFRGLGRSLTFLTCAITTCGECDHKIWPQLFKCWIALSTG